MVVYKSILPYRFKLLTKVCFFIFIFTTYSALHAQIDTTKSTIVEKESEILDTVYILKSATDDIKSKVEYSADDSIVFDMKTKKMYLYNNSKINYEDISIDAYFIDYDWTNSELEGNQLENGDTILGKPYMKQADRDYYTRKLKYNFKSQQGKVYDIVTQEGEGYLHGHEVKKVDENVWYISKAKYTTCNLEDPHFYIASNKMKLITKKSIISGPANIRVHDVPIPIYLPFGIFPLDKGKRSGIILPTEYGISPLFNLKNLGFYWAISDHVDAVLSTDIYLNGSYSFRSILNYSERYKFGGSFDIGFNRIFIASDADNPVERAKTPANFRLNWRHTQDLKAHPTISFNSNLSFQTQGYFTRSLDLTERSSNGNINSNLNFSKRFRNSPFIINAGIGYTQYLAKETISGNLATASLNYNGTPIKVRRNSNSVLNFINLNYSTQFKSNINNLADSSIFTRQLFDKLNYGVYSLFSLQLGSLKLFKNLNFNPTFEYNDRLYFKKLEITNDRDSIYRNGVYGVRDFTGGASLQTTIMGIFNFGPNAGFRGIKHILVPSVGYNYTPNFSTGTWNYFQTYLDSNEKEVIYYPYSTDLNLGAVPSQSLQSSIRFGIRNSFEGKFRKRTDTSTTYIKRMLLDNISFGSSYNFAADSFNLNDFTLSISNSTLGFLTFSSDLIFDPYRYEYARKTKYYLGIDNKLLRMTMLRSTVALNLNARNFSKQVLESSYGNEAQRDYIYNNYYNFYDFKNPWNFSLSTTFFLENTYSRFDYTDTTKISASINLRNFDFNLTRNWKIAIQSGYNFSTSQISLTTISAIRNMHCWEIRIRYSPISQYGQAYLIEISPKASILQDLKLSRNRPSIDNYF